MVTISYQQTIHAYPGGGGAYIVARDNLGELPAQIAGAALLTDYILTVSVSISSGVAQLTSGFPALLPFRVVFAVLIVGLMMVVNLRGVKESGTAFAIPTYFFLGVTLLTIGMGFVRFFSGTLSPVTGVTPAVVEAVQGVSIVPDPACFFERLYRADRRGSHLERYPGIQGTEKPQRRRYIDLDECDPIIHFPEHYLPGQPDRCALLI